LVGSVFGRRCTVRRGDGDAHLNHVRQGLAIADAVAERIVAAPVAVRRVQEAAIGVQAESAVIGQDLPVDARIFFMSSFAFINRSYSSCRRRTLNRRDPSFRSNSFRSDDDGVSWRAIVLRTAQAFVAPRAATPEGAGRVPICIQPCAYWLVPMGRLRVCCYPIPR